MACWIYANFSQKNKLFLTLFVLIVLQKNILLAQSDAPANQEILQCDCSVSHGDTPVNHEILQEAKTDQVDSQDSKKNIGGIPELVGNLDGKNCDVDINSMQDFFQEMMKIWAEAKKREEERKLLFFSKLSPEHQELLKAAQTQYSNFLESVDIRNGLAQLCKDTRNGLEQLGDRIVPKKFEQLQNLHLQNVLLKIKKLQTAIALDYCYFLPKRMKGMSSKGIEDMSGVMNGLMENMISGGQGVGSLQRDDEESETSENSDLAFSTEDLSDFCDSLHKLMKSGIFDCAKNEDQELADLKNKTEDLVGLLSDILSSVLNGNTKDLILCYVTYLEPEFNATVEILKKAQKAFELEVKAYIADHSGNIFENEKDLIGTDAQKAYIFWFKDIKKCQRTMLVYSTLKGSSSSCTQGTENLFKTVAYAYDIASCFYGFYKKDRDKEYALWENANDKVKHNTPLLEKEQRDILIENTQRDVCKVLNWRNQVLIPKAVDWGISSGMALWHFFLNSPNITNGLLLQPMLGNMPLNMIDVKQTAILNFMAAPYAFRILLDPSSSNWQAPKWANALGKVAGAWAYYHVFYGRLFGNNHDAHWDANYPHIKDSTYNALIEVEKIVSRSFSAAIRRNTNPELVEKIENWSLGVIKPEMIEYFAAEMIPLILFNQVKLGEKSAFPNKDYYSNLIFGTCDDNFLKSRASATHISEYDSFSDDQKHEVSLKSYYVEACISYYIASSVGKTLGVAFARRMQGPSLNFATYAGGKCLDGLAYLHIIGKDTREMFTALNEELIEGFEENIMILKMLLKTGFAPNSPFRMMLVKHLKDRGDIAVDKNSSEEKINGELLYFLLKQCAQRELITHLEAAEINKCYLSTQQFDDELIEKIVLAIKKNILAPVGGTIGSWVATYALKLFTRYNGPIQLVPGKIKNSVFHK